MQTESRRILSPAVPWILCPGGCGRMMLGPWIWREVVVLPVLTGVSALLRDQLSPGTICICIAVAQDTPWEQTEIWRVLFQSAPWFLYPKGFWREPLSSSGSFTYAFSFVCTSGMLALSRFYLGIRALWQRISSRHRWKPEGSTNPFQCNKKYLGA